MICSLYIVYATGLPFTDTLLTFPPSLKSKTISHGASMLKSISILPQTALSFLSGRDKNRLYSRSRIFSLRSRASSDETPASYIADSFPVLTSQDHNSKRTRTHVNSFNFIFRIFCEDIIKCNKVALLNHLIAFYCVNINLL